METLIPCVVYKMDLLSKVRYALIRLLAGKAAIVLNVKITPVQVLKDVPLCAPFRHGILCERVTFVERSDFTLVGNVGVMLSERKD